MPTLYCTADGAGPRACPDWRRIAASVSGDAALESVTARRLTEPGHAARNGNPPKDGKCPECGAPVAVGDAVSDADHAAETQRIIDAAMLAQALAELPDTGDGMADAVLLVGGPLDSQVVDWPATSAWQTVRSWFGADASIRVFAFGSQSVTYRRDGGSASWVG